MPKGHKGVGGYIGTAGSYEIGGVFSTKEAQLLKSGNNWAGLVTSGLVLNLDASNTSSYPGTGTTWTDTSGNGNSVTINSTVTFSSSNGGSFVFNGGYMYASNFNNIPTGDLTLSFWAKTSNSGTAQWLAQFGRSSTDSNTEGAFNINTSNKQSWWDYDSGYGFSDIVSNSTLSLNTWYHFTFVRSGLNGYFYLNGVADGGGTAAKVASLSSNDFAIGRDYRDNNAVFYGSIGAVHMYNTALTAGQVSRNFNFARGRFGI